MTTVNVAEAKARLSELVERAESSEDVQIARRGQPAVRLVPVVRRKKPFDWDALKAFTDTLSTLTVEEMRRRDIL